MDWDRERVQEDDARRHYIKGATHSEHSPMEHILGIGQELSDPEQREKDNPTIRMLYHGTCAIPPSVIFEKGFDMKFCATGMWG